MKAISGRLLALLFDDSVVGDDATYTSKKDCSYDHPDHRSTGSS